MSNLLSILIIVGIALFLMYLVFVVTFVRWWMDKFLDILR